MQIPVCSGNGTSALGDEQGVSRTTRSSLGGHTASQMNTHPADLECMASVDGANKLVQALRRSLAMQINADMEKCTDKYVYGGIGRTALRRRSGQTL